MNKRIALFALALLLAVGLSVVGATGQKEGPLGSEENPIVWAFVPSGEMERVASGAKSVAKLLHEETSSHAPTPAAHASMS